MYTKNTLFKHKLGTCLRMDYVLGRPIKSQIHIYNNGKKILMGSYYDHNKSPEKLKKVIQRIRQDEEIKPTAKEFLDSLPEQINPSHKKSDLQSLCIIKFLVEKIKSQEPNQAVMQHKATHIPLNKKTDRSR